MFIKSFKISNKLKYILPISLILVLLVSIYFAFFHNSSTLPTSVTPDPLHGIWQSDGNMTIENTTIDSQTNENKEEKKYIKWFEFNVCYDALVKTAKLDVDSHVNGEAIQYNWIELISYLACKYGNDFSKFKQKDLDTLVEKLKSGQTIADLTKDLKNYSYYFEGYDAVLHEFIGEYQKEIAESTTKNVQNSQNAENVENTENIENTQNLENSSKGVKKPQFETTYGLKAFHPVAKKCEIQVSYAIGMEQPLSVYVDTFGTGTIPEEQIVELIQEKFDLTPNGIIKYLDLKKPIYKETTNYGHFGKENMTWEKIISL